MEGYFLFATAVILFVIALAEFSSAVSGARVLEQSDPLLPLSNRLVFILIGTLELLLSAYLLAGKDNWLKLGLAACLASDLMVYRIGLAWGGMPNFSDCLGNFNPWLPIPPRVLSGTMTLIIGYLIFGSYAFLILDWFLERRKSVKAKAVIIGKPQRA